MRSCPHCFLGRTHRSTSARRSEGSSRAPIKTLGFYRLLGLPTPAGLDGEANADVETGDGCTLGFLTAAMAARADPGYRPPGGQSLNLQFRCDTPAEVDAAFHRLVQAGAGGYAEPWDAFWGQRFARVSDPDGRVVNLYAEL